MITCDFSKRKNQTLSQYLYSQIKEQILMGQLIPNQRLPSKRSLADHLGISVITVQGAYQNLIDEGFIYSIEKSGFFVEDIHQPVKKNKEEKLKKQSVKKTQKNVIGDFTQNAIGYEKFPFKTWAKVSKQVLQKYNYELLAPGPSSGNLILRQTIADYLKNYRNMNVDSSQIVIGAGSELLYNFIVLMLGSNKIYGVENPGYKKTHKIFSTLGAECIPIDIDENGMSCSKLEMSCAQVIHITPSHHFPTGIVMPVKRRFELLSWAAQEKDRYIIEDDYDSEFRFSGKPLEPMFNSDLNSRVIYLNTFSKTLSPAFRISYMVLPEKLVEVFKNKFEFYSCTVSAVEQLTVAEFIKQEYFSKHINRMRNYYRSLRNNLITNIKNSQLKNRVTIKEENSGLHFLMIVKTTKSVKQIKNEIQKSRLKINLLDDYYFGKPPENENAFVINYSGIREQDISKIINAFQKIF